MDKGLYLSGFGEALIFIIVGALFVSVTMLVSRFLRPDRPNPEKLSTYESGEEAIGSAWVQFNFRFYVVALIFLLFEVEIVFLFPWTTVYADPLLQEAAPQWGWLAMGEMVVFIAILALGLAYAWRNGFLTWDKPNPTPTRHQSNVPTALYDAINDKYKRSADSKK
ncbi:NADH-quinone oxidoreductase subunit A [Chryseolinea sp. T2]|uniref:NADH-quinone oxidoreductase subunit A n=1 Tax=Chryseolinea sp. T2 TaxID=3129255 RepID=UPI003078613D